MASLKIIEEFERLWGNYIDKLARIDELKRNGRYGYQLRMPYKSLSIAERELLEFCKTNRVEPPPGVGGYAS